MLAHALYICFTGCVYNTALRQHVLQLLEYLNAMPWDELGLPLECK